MIAWASYNGLLKGMKSFYVNSMACVRVLNSMSE